MEFLYKYSLVIFFFFLVITGQMPRLSKVNLFTLLSLWMELFPSAEQQKKSQVKCLCLLLISLPEELLQ